MTTPLPLDGVLVYHYPPQFSQTPITYEHMRVNKGQVFLPTNLLIESMKKHAYHYITAPLLGACTPQKKLSKM